MANIRLKRRFRFGLRSLFVAMTLVCLLFALLAQPLIEARRESLFVRQAGKLGANVRQWGRIRHSPSVGRWLLGFFDNKYTLGFLYRVDFSGTSVSDRDLALFDRTPFVSQVDLSNTKVTDAGMTHLSECPHLYDLDLSKTLVTDAGVLRLNKLERLASLDIAETQISYTALRELDHQLPWAHFAEQKAIAAIRAIGGQVPAKSRVIEVPDKDPLLIASNFVGEIAEKVILGMNRGLVLTRSDLALLGHLDSLRSLNIHSIRIEPGSFADVGALPNLRTLEIYHTNIADNDLQHLSRQIHLETLVLHSGKRITDVGISKLAALDSLKSLVVTACDDVTPTAIEALRQQLPSCKIEYSKW